MTDVRSTAALVSTTSTWSAVQRIARTAIPSLADFCLVYLVSGSSIVCVASAHATRDGTRVVRTLMRTYRVRRNDRSSTVAQVVRLAKPMRRTGIQPERGRGPDGDPVADLHRRLAPCSALAVPIGAPPHVLGALSLCYSHSGRSYGARDVSAAMHLAARIARVLTKNLADGTLRLRAAVGHAGQGTTVRRRLAARN